MSRRKPRTTAKRVGVDTTTPVMGWVHNQSKSIAAHLIPFDGSKVDHDLCERPMTIRQGILSGLHQTEILRPVDAIDSQELDHLHKLPPWIMKQHASKDPETLELEKVLPMLKGLFGIQGHHDFVSILFLARQASETSDIAVHFDSQKPRQPYWTERFDDHEHKGMVIVHNSTALCIPDALGAQIEEAVSRFPTPRHLLTMNAVVSREILMHPIIGFRSDDFREAKLVFDYGQTWMSVDDARRNMRGSYCISVSLQLEDRAGSILVYMKRKLYEKWIAHNAIEFFAHATPRERARYLPGDWQYPEAVQALYPQTWARMRWGKAIRMVVQKNRVAARHRRKLADHERLETLKNREEREERRKIRAAAEAKKRLEQEEAAQPAKSATSTLHKSTDIMRGESAAAKALGQRAEATARYKGAVRKCLEEKARRVAEEEERLAEQKRCREVAFAIVSGA